MQQQLSQININTDFGIFILILLLVVYAILLGQEKVKTLALSAYVGIVLAREAAPAIADWLASQRWDFNGSLSEGMVALILFGLPLLTLELGKKGRRGHKVHNSMLITLCIAIMTSFVIVAYGAEFIGEAGIKDFLDQSTLATQIYRLKLAWTLGVPLLIAVQSFMHHHHE